MWGRTLQPWDHHGEQAVTLTFDLLMLCCVDQSESMQFSNTRGAMAERKSMTSDCPCADASLGERREGPQLEPDSVTNVCIFSTGNHSEVSSVWSGTENTFLLTEQRQIQAAKFHGSVINCFGNKTGYYKHRATRDKCSAVSGTKHLAALFETVFEHNLLLKVSRFLSVGQFYDTL